MASVEERLAKVEREIALLRDQHKIWPIAQVNERFRDDDVLKEIFRLGKEERERERKKDPE